jgi:hypothetical protein
MPCPYSVGKVQECANIVALFGTPGHKGHGGKIIITTDLVYEKTRDYPLGDEGYFQCILSGLEVEPERIVPTL